MKQAIVAMQVRHPSSKTYADVALLLLSSDVPEKKEPMEQTAWLKRKKGLLSTSPDIIICQAITQKIVHAQLPGLPLHL